MVYKPGSVRINGDDHSSGIYLLDKNGKIRVRHSYGSDIKLIVEDIEKLI